MFEPRAETQPVTVQVKHRLPAVVGALRNRALHGSALLAGEVGAATLGFLVAVLSVRSLGLAEFGRFGIATAAVATLSTILDIRMEEMAARRFQEEVSAGNFPNRVWSTYLCVDLLFGLAKFAVLIACLPLLSYMYGGKVASVAALLGVGMAVCVADNTVVIALTMRRQFGVIAATRVAAPLIRLALIILVRPASASGLGILMVTGTLLSTTLLLLTVRNLLTRPFGRRWVRAEIRRSGPAIIQLSVASTLRGGSAQADVLVAGALLGPSGSAILSLARTLSVAPSLVSTVIRSVETPGTIRLAIAGDHRRLRRTFARISTASLAVGVAAIGGWMLLGPWIVDRVFGPRSAAVTDITLILLVAGTLEITTSWSKLVPAVLGRGRFTLFEAFWYGASRLGFALLLGSRYGIAGVAMAAVITSGTATAVWLGMLPGLGRRTLSAASQEVCPETRAIDFGSNDSEEVAEERCGTLAGSALPPA